MKYRLKEEHPAMKALEELCNKADELGIQISTTGYSCTVTINDEEFMLEDIEQSDYPMTVFPPCCEFKLTYEKKEE